MAVGRAGLDRLDDLVDLRIDHHDCGAVFAGDVDQPVGAELERVRRDVRTQIDSRDMGAFAQVEHAEQMLRIGIAAVDAVAEDRHIGHAGLRNDEQFVDRLGEAVDHDFGRVGDGIEKQHLAAHLVDRDDALFWVGHCSFPCRRHSGAEPRGPARSPMTNSARSPGSISTASWIMTQAFKNVTISDYGFRARASRAPE